MTRLEAVREIVEAHCVTQRETMSKAGWATQDREMHEALKVLGVSNEEINEAVRLEKS